MKHTYIHPSFAFLNLVQKIIFTLHSSTAMIFVYLHLVGWDHQHALEDLGEISEVEGVVRLGRSGK